MHSLVSAVVLRARGTAEDELDSERDPPRRQLVNPAIPTDEANGCELSLWIAFGIPERSKTDRTRAARHRGHVADAAGRRARAGLSSRTVSGSQRLRSSVRHQPLKSTVHRSLGASTMGAADSPASCPSMTVADDAGRKRSPSRQHPRRDRRRAVAVNPLSSLMQLARAQLEGDLRSQSFLRHLVVVSNGGVSGRRGSSTSP